MPKALLFTKDGERTGLIELPPEIFGHKPKKHLLWEVVKAYLANRRAGTHKAKTRSEVSYSGAKLWPQKGLGRARHGSISAPIFVGGGKAHGPKPRDYRIKINAKVKKLALSHALSDRARENRVFVMQEFTLDEPKTKKMVALLNKMGLEDKKVILLSADANRNFYLSSRNIPRVTFKLAKDVNALDVLNSEYVVLEKKAIDTLKERLVI